MAQANPEALAESEAVRACVVDNNCMDQLCVDQNCPFEAFDCYTGDDTCLDLNTCVFECAGDEACEAACHYASSPLAQNQIEELNACALDNACADDDCLTEFCTEEYVSCINGGSDGLACVPLATCVIDCQYDPLCSLGCAPPISPEAEAEADALIACAEIAMCDTFACTEELCSNQWGVCVSSEQTCAEIYACVYSCKGAELCEINCKHEGMFLDQYFLYLLETCISDNACQNDDCIAQNCATEAMDCGV
ncbi:hypothetical protein ENSA7_12450 [Enhygromyxa salina]|uniref:Uncharacterized protein n=1 Tax=Enhygromyxa salina TaxID=215803 RepID=A0A2S9YV67_9BACT|nr:hypothetical protein ENSA7_12450 [Enhygromyxa salina]